MSEVQERIGQLKTKAKNRRDLGRYSQAVQFINEAIALARGERDTARVADWRATMASELADCLGILGGIERRWALDPDSEAGRVEHLHKSIDAYEDGYVVESDPALEPSTYNRLNRLLSRLLLDPQLLSDTESAPDSAGTFSLRRELEDIARQIESDATKSVWPAADLALVNILLGRKDAATAYTTFERLRPPDYACQSALDMVSALAKMDLSTAPELKKAEHRLIALRDSTHQR
jgi:hypothetical protein